MNTMSMQIEIPDVSSDDYDWCAERAIEILFNLGVDGPDTNDITGNEVGDRCQTLAMALVWRLRHIIDPAVYGNDTHNTVYTARHSI